MKGSSEEAAWIDTSLGYTGGINSMHTYMYLVGIVDILFWSN